MSFFDRMLIGDHSLNQYNEHSKDENVLHLPLPTPSPHNPLDKLYKIFPRVSIRNGNTPHLNWASSERSVLLK